MIYSEHLPHSSEVCSCIIIKPAVDYKQMGCGKTLNI